MKRTFRETGTVRRHRNRLACFTAGAHVMFQKGVPSLVDSHPPDPTMCCNPSMFGVESDRHNHQEAWC